MSLAIVLPERASPASGYPTRARFDTKVRFQELIMNEDIIIGGRALLLSNPENDGEFDRIVELNEAVHGSGVRDLCRALYGSYPGMSRSDWYAVVDPGTGRALSTLCRIPTIWTYRAGAAAGAVSVDVPAAELSIVATAEDARGLGLSSLLVRRYEADSARLGFTLSTIEGIPYYYRRFGYEYAAPLCVQLRLDPGLSPREGNARDSWRPAAPAAGMEPGGPGRLALAAAASALALSIREAGPADAPTLSALFDESSRGLGLCARREPALWDYLLGPGLASTETAARRLLAYRGEAVVGYLGLCADGFGPGWTVLEAAVEAIPSELERRAVAYALLAEAERQRAVHGAAHLVVSLPRSHELSALALELGADDRQEYGWQARIVDPAAFCRLVAPVLEARLAASSWKGVAYALTLDLYGKALRLAWDGSRLTAENGSAQGAVPGHAPERSLPPELFAPLALGYRSVADLRRLRHDVSIYGEAEAFLDVLFPVTDAFVHQFV